MGRHAKRPTSRSTPLQRWLKTPKGYVLVVLLVLMVLAAWHPSDRAGIVHVLLAMATVMAVDGVAALVRRSGAVVSDGGAITGLIVGLVLSATAPHQVVVAASGIAALSKHLLKQGRKPIFNPAAFGLWLAFLLYGSGQSWWGALTDLPGWMIVFLLVAGYLVTERVNKFPQVFSFLGLYFGLLWAIGHWFGVEPMFLPGLALRSPDLNSALFLATFMLTDPPTSPGPYRDQVIFGGLAALVSVAVYTISGTLVFQLIGLLTANAWKAWAARRKPVPVRAQTPALAERRERLRQPPVPSRAAQTHGPRTKRAR